MPAFAKPLPDSATEVPPSDVPDEGVTEFSVSAALYEKPSARVSDPFEFVTATSTLAPAVPAGVIHMMVVSSTVTTFVAAAPPKVTVFGPAPPAWKPLPEIITAVPPAAGPDEGMTVAMAGPETDW